MTAPRIPFRQPAFLFWTAVSALVAGLSMFHSLTGVTGWEFSFAMSVIAGVSSGHLAALRPSLIRAQKAPFPGAQSAALRLFASAAAVSLLPLVLPVVLISLNALRMPPCNNTDGALFFLLLPVVSSLAATAAGLLCGLLLPGAVLPVVLWFMLVSASFVLSLREVWTTPAVFTFNHFFGFHPGVLYDTVIGIRPALLTFRLSTLAIIAACLLCMDSFLDPATLRLTLRKQAFARSRLIAAAALAAVIAAFQVYAVPLGHASSDARLQQLLSKKITTGNLTLFIEPGTPQQRAMALCEDLLFSLHRVETALGVSAGPLRVYVFANARQKQRAMGATVSMVKPWRNEAYIVWNGPGDSTARHELAHLAAASIAGGPLGLAGRGGGLIPDPGLIEGLATALEGPGGHLELHASARAMKDLGILPAINALSGPGFLTLHSGAAYTAAGSFWAFVMHTRGARAMRRIYGGEGIRRVTGRSPEELEKDWHRFLDGVHLSDPDRRFAAFLYDRPSIVATRCVHEVSRLHGEAADALEGGRCEDSLTLLDEAFRKSGRSTAAGMRRFNGLIRCGDPRATDAGRQLMADHPGVRTVAIREALADARLAAGDAPDPAEYEDLYRVAVSDDDRRRLHVKAALLRMGDAPARAAADALSVVPAPGRSADGVLLSIARFHARHPDEPLAAYLLARQHLRVDDAGPAAELLTSAFEHGLTDEAPELVAEARFMAGRAFYLLGRFDEAERWFSLNRTAGGSSGQAALAEDWMARIRWKKARSR